VKQKLLVINLVQMVAFWLCVFDPTASAQPSDEKPDRAFWPREVRISEEVKVEQKTKYGVVTSKRTAGSVVKVVSLDSDSLRIASDGFQGTIEVEKTDFWDRAGKARETAIDKQKGERLLAKERAIREAEERMRVEKIKRYEAATVLQIEITQVLNNGCLARVLNDSQKRIFLELTGPDFVQGQRYEVRAEQSGTFKYTTVLGAPSTIERWTPLAKP
jgi:hypothetical protein